MPGRLSVLSLCLLAGCSTVFAQNAPVVLELYTSEGCSSCPPADKLLLQMEKSGAVEGVPVVVLGEHVDYWDHQGWRDMYSNNQFTLRQTTYQTRIHFQEPFTPQVIVDGEASVLGSDASALSSAIKQAAARRSKATLTLAQNAPAEVSTKLTGNSFGKVDVFLAVVESGLSSSVKSGENAGRTIEHAAVVRKLNKVASGKSETVDGIAKLPLNDKWKAENIRLVAFAQVASTGQIVASSVIDWRK